MMTANNMIVFAAKARLTVVKNRLPICTFVHLLVRNMLKYGAKQPEKADFAKKY